jgi:phage/plasmid-like protein (TIGR03299 family)
MSNIINQAFEGIKVNDIANAQAVSELLDKYGLRWTVSKQQLYLADGVETPYFAVVKDVTDPDDVPQVFQTCKDSYVPYQNSELAELLIRIADQGGYKIHSGGEFNNGAKVYLQLESGNEIKNIGKNNTKVLGYISGINSHDGTTALKWGAVNFTICCRNTFAAAKGSLQNTTKHTNSMQRKVDAYLQDIGLVVRQEQSLFDTFIKLSENKVSQKDIVKVVKEVTDVDIMLDQYEAEQKYSTYQMNRGKELLTSIQSEMSVKGETLWGLFSGVTHYTSHVMPVMTRDNARLESKYLGTANRVDNQVLSLIMSDLKLSFN